MNEVLHLAREGAFGVPVCRKMDRLARDMGKQLFIEDKLADVSIQIEIEYVYYKNAFCSGVPPYGYTKATVDGKRTLEIAPEEAEIVREIFDLYLDVVGWGVQGTRSG